MTSGTIDDDESNDDTFSAPAVAYKFQPSVDRAPTSVQATQNSQQVLEQACNTDRTRNGSSIRREEC